MGLNGTSVEISPAGFSTPGLANEGYKIWLALVIMIISSGSFVVARVAIRIKARAMGADDFAIIAALSSCLIQTTLWALSVRTGYGAEYDRLDDWHKQRFNMWWFMGSLFYPVTLCLFKTSVILLTKRIFVQRGFQIACWCTLVVNSCWALGNLLGWLLQCLPIPMMWGAVTKGVCWDMTGEWISLTVWDVVSDAWIMAMPVPMIWKLNLRKKDKIMLTGLFFLAAIVIVFSVMSCSAVMTSIQTQDKHPTKQYAYALANLFQVLESNMGIIGACLPVLRQPLRDLFPRIFGSSKSARRQSRYYYDDSFNNKYVLQNMSNRQKDGSWHNVTVSGPELFKSSPRKSDELGIIGEDERDGAWTDGGAVRADSVPQGAIRKNMVVSVDRK